jgi:hypothetical protein
VVNGIWSLKAGVQWRCVFNVVVYRLSWYRADTRGEKLNGVFNMGVFETGRRRAFPLCACSTSSGSSHGKDLGIGTGAVVGGVKPVDLRLNLGGCES